MIDIVLATCERLDLLQRTLASIWRNTQTPYRLTVIDDASTTGNRDYVRGLYEEGKIAGCVLRPRRLGISANLRAIAELTRSELVVYCDDDQLCPNVTPDWLSRELAAMAARRTLGILSLNNPHANVRGDKRHRIGCDGTVTYCERSGGSYLCIRRHLLWRIVPGDGIRSPVSRMCARAIELGWQNGYLTETYTQHIGTVSVRNGVDLSGELKLLGAVDPETLEPREAYRL